MKARMNPICSCRLERLCLMLQSNVEQINFSTNSTKNLTRNLNKSNVNLKKAADLIHSKIRKILWKFLMVLMKIFANHSTNFLKPSTDGVKMLLPRILSHAIKELLTKWKLDVADGNVTSRTLQNAHQTKRSKCDQSFCFKQFFFAFENGIASYHCFPFFSLTYL